MPHGANFVFLQRGKTCKFSCFAWCLEQITVTVVKATKKLIWLALIVTLVLAATDRLSGQKYPKIQVSTLSAIGSHGKAISFGSRE